MSKMDFRIVLLSIVTDWCTNPYDNAQTRDTLMFPEGPGGLTFSDD